MPRITWPLHHGRPAIEIELLIPDSERREDRVLVADTGAGPDWAPFDLLLDEDDCIASCSGSSGLVGLTGAYSGRFRTYFVEVRLPGLADTGIVKAVGIDHPPRGFHGIAGFRFLNRFTYGNFGNSAQFGLDVKPKS